MEAKRMRVVKQNPCDGLVFPKVKRRRNVVLRAEQLDLFANPSSLVESMMVVSIHTMMRRSEVCRLKWSELQGETILLERDKTDDGRAVPMSPQVSQILRSQPKRSVYVFTRDNGAPPDPDWYTDEWKKWRDARGIDKRVRLHDLRGTGITILLSEGYDVKTVQSIARHRDAKTTLNIYAQVVDANRKSAVSALSKHTSKAHSSKWMNLKKA
jgi:integrase